MKEERGGGGRARASLRDIILILLPGRDTRAPLKKTSKIYGQFFLLIFITSTCERATKRAFPCPLNRPRREDSASREARGKLPRMGAGVTSPLSLYRRCTWNGIFSYAPIPVKLHGLYFRKRNSGDFQVYVRMYSAQTSANPKRTAILTTRERETSDFNEIRVQYD